MVTLKNIHRATHGSWRYPTKHVSPESVYLNFCVMGGMGVWGYEGMGLCSPAVLFNFAEMRGER